VAVTVSFLVWVWPAPVGVFLGLVMAFLVWFSRPQLAAHPKGSVVERAEAPEFFRLADEISASAGALPFGAVLLDGEVATSSVRPGVRRSTVLSIGLPLWESLTPDERVALVAHEAGHGVNGDPWRGLLIGTSLRTLDHWHDFARPGTKQEAKEEGLLAQFTWGGQWVAAAAIEVVRKLQTRITMPAHRRAEFQADRVAASVAGTSAVCSLLDRTIFESSINFAVRRAIRNDDDIWDSIRRRFDELPESDRTTIRHAAVVDAVSTDDDHPPTHERVEALRSAAHEPGRVHLDRVWSERIDHEFAASRARVADELRAAQRASS
jgi:Zn-dependent protease with chaperone function